MSVAETDLPALEIPSMKSLGNWYGSNRTCAPDVGVALAGCDFVNVVFAGGMSEIPFIGARSILVNDKHADMINLARVCSDNVLGPYLRRELGRLVYHEQTLKMSQERLQRYRVDGPLFARSVDGAAYSDVERAVDYFVVCWMSRAGAAGCRGELKGGFSVRYNATGGDSAVRFQSARRSLLAWARTTQRCVFTAKDWADNLDEFAACHSPKAKKTKAESSEKKIGPRNQPGCYVDPPFPEVGDCYLHKLDPEAHARLATRLRNMPPKVRVVVRYYDHPLIRDLYPERSLLCPEGWEWRRLKGRDQQNQEKPEILLVRGPDYSPKAKENK